MVTVDTGVDDSDDDALTPGTGQSWRVQATPETGGADPIGSGVGIVFIKSVSLDKPHVRSCRHQGGVPLVAGTDGLAGFTLQAELKYYQEAGISAADILKLATIGSARVMGVADEVGRIAPGLRADLILVDGKPDQDIDDITAVSWVMKSGEIYDPDLLYEALSIRPKPTAESTRQ